MAAFWATIVSYVLGIPARYYAYAAVAVGIFFVGCHCGRGFGVSPQKADPNVVLVEHADPCPVNGSNCTCGCQSGKPCNCAISRVADERLSRLDQQALAYRDLCEWAEKHPGVPVAVFVNIQPYIHGAYGPDVICRYDRGWPHLVGPWVIYAVFRDGEFTQFRQESLLPRLMAPRQTFVQTFQPFGGNCPSGNCRSR